MGRSPGFGPCAHRLPPFSDLVSLRVLCSLHLPLAGTRSSPDRSTKSTRLHSCGAPAGRRHRVSGSLSLPSRGPFHLSLTVLCAIGHWLVFSLGGWSPRLPTGFHVSRGTPDSACPARDFEYGAFTLFGRLSQNRSSIAPLLFGGPYPEVRTLRFGLFPFRSPLLWESIFLSLPPGT